MTRPYDYSAITPATVRKAVADGLAEADGLVAGAIAVDGPRTFDNTIDPLLRAANAVWTADGRSTFVGFVHPELEVRDVATEARKQTDGWRAAFARRDDVAEAVLAYAASADAQTLEPGRRRFLDLLRGDIQRAGHELDPAKRAELAVLDQRLVDLGATFGSNLAEWKDELALGPGDLAGLSPAFVEQLPLDPGLGTRRLEITYSVVWPFLEQSERRDLREVVLRKYLSRAAEINRPVIDELLDLRRRKARLLGFPSHSQFANEARMSGGADEVRAFLDRTLPQLRRLADEERARMRDLLVRDGVDGDVEAWDWAYLHERQRRELGFDGPTLAEYLPLEAVLAGLFSLVRDVFGVAVEATDGEGYWHPDVRTFTLHDSVTGERLADLLLDLFARDGKRPGAWQLPLVDAVNRAGEPRVPPLILLLTNFAPPSPDGHVLISDDDVSTLFHEFGHALEFGLRQSEGHILHDHWLELDFVEAPSQIMENWVSAPEVLRRFARHHETGEPPPDHLLDGLARTQRLNIGIATLWVFGWRTVLDQLLHGPDAVDSAEAYRKAFAVTGFPFPEGTYQPSSFHHLEGMYAAGFYSYLWARVFGDDMFSAFREAGLLSPETGRRYRRTVLEPSWSLSGRERTRTFLGREPSDRAFLERLGIAPDPVLS